MSVSMKLLLTVSTKYLVKIVLLGVVVVEACLCAFKTVHTKNKMDFTNNMRHVK